MPFIFIYLFLWLHWVFTAARAFSSCCGGDCCPDRCTGSSPQWLLLLWSTAFRVRAQHCRTRASLPLACEIFLDQGLNPWPLHLAGRYFTIKPPEKSSGVCILTKTIHSPFRVSNSIKMKLLDYWCGYLMLFMVLLGNLGVSIQYQGLIECFQGRQRG